MGKSPGECVSDARRLQGEFVTRSRFRGTQLAPSLNVIEGFKVDSPDQLGLGNIKGPFSGALPLRPLPQRGLARGYRCNVRRSRPRMSAGRAGR
jgi:hypothetical protein